MVRVVSADDEQQSSAGSIYTPAEKKGFIALSSEVITLGEIFDKLI